MLVLTTDSRWGRRAPAGDNLVQPGTFRATQKTTVITVSAVVTQGRVIESLGLPCHWRRVHRANITTRPTKAITTSGLKPNAPDTSPSTNEADARIAPHPGQYRPVSHRKGQVG